MKYINEFDNTMYDNAKDCIAAEKAFEEKRAAERKEKEMKDAERKTRAKEVEDARKAMVAARTKYAELLEAFTQDYGVFHQTLTGEDAKRAIPTLFGFLDDLFL